jgi:hypothetical protein
MNADQIGGIIRAITPLAVIVAAHFGIGEPTVTLIAGAISTVVVAIWSAYTNRPGTVIPPKS